MLCGKQSKQNYFNSIKHTSLFLKIFIMNQNFPGGCLGIFHNSFSNLNYFIQNGNSILLCSWVDWAVAIG